MREFTGEFYRQTGRAPDRCRKSLIYCFHPAAESDILRNDSNRFAASELSSPLSFAIGRKNKKGMSMVISLASLHHFFFAFLINNDRARQIMSRHWQKQSYPVMTCSVKTRHVMLSQDVSCHVQSRCVMSCSVAMTYDMFSQNDLFYAQSRRVMPHSVNILC